VGLKYNRIKVAFRLTKGPCMVSIYCHCDIDNNTDLVKIILRRPILMRNEMMAFKTFFISSINIDLVL
jgi:hypothetical protein